MTDVEETGGDETGGEETGSVDNATKVLDYLVQQVVDNPDEVSVTAGPGRRSEVQLDVRVADGDMGRVIGKRGRIAQSIRTVTRAAATKDGTTVDIEFVD